MNPRYIIILAMALLISSMVIDNVKADSELKTDLKTITTLSNTGFMTPALHKNQTFVYSNFEFHLYSNINNTGYTIIVDNVTIANRTISHFKDVFLWEAKTDYIDLLEVYISKDYYSYSNIFVFTREITNRTFGDDDDNLVKFTKEELKNYIREIEQKMVLGNFLALIIFGSICTYYVKKYKDVKIESVL